MRLSTKGKTILPGLSTNMKARGEGGQQNARGTNPVTPEVTRSARPWPPTTPEAAESPPFSDRSATSWAARCVLTSDCYRRDDCETHQAEAALGETQRVSTGTMSTRMKRGPQVAPRPETTRRLGREAIPRSAQTRIWGLGLLVWETQIHAHRDIVTV